ncbi:MAG: hypothetical protein ACM3JD_13905 [Rudaea sp.]
MRRKRYGFLSYGDAYMTREQVVRTLDLPKSVVDRLIATGQLTQYRCAIGPGRGGQRIFYARMQVERVKSQLKPKARRAARTRRI